MEGNLQLRKISSGVQMLRDQIHTELLRGRVGERVKPQ